MRRALRWLFGGAILILMALGLGTLVPRPLFDQATQAETEPGEPAHTVLILSSAIHTDIALPLTAEIAERFGFMAEHGLDPAMDGAAYVVAGWGGRSFYIETPTWADLKPGPVFKALTIDRSVMHMALIGPVDPFHPDVIAFDLDAEAFERLVDAVYASFEASDETGPVLIAGAQYGKFDRFYEARGVFNAVAGCNLWTARMLRAAGLRVGWWTPLPPMLDASVRLHNSGRIY
jgi:uncharacterized protein (TIGR02117 family)